MDLFIPGPAGRLQAKLWLPSGSELGDGLPPKSAASPRAAAVVCHPHPLHGGTMDNNVVFRTARGLQSAGLAVLRFNFRGAGQSEGQHDGRGAEERDAQAALDWLAERFPGVPLWAAGFSFGARTLASLARHERRLARLLLIALPARVFDCEFVRDVLPSTRVLLAGNDSFGNLSDLMASVGTLPAHVQAEEIPGTDHFFRGRTPELEARVRAWAQEAQR